MPDSEMVKLQEIIDQSSRIVFFGGAGVSTESGIPDFRSADGLYNQRWPCPPEEILSRSFYEAHPALFFEFYRERILAWDAQPNAAHHKLAELEKAGKLKAVVTQNIDGLHSAAGSQNVIELHGSIHRNYCRRCGQAYDARFMRGAGHDGAPAVPTCVCGGPVKPDVVLYEEPLDGDVIARAVKAIAAADALIIGGTSLVVHPAAGLVDYYTGDSLVVINRQPTHKDRAANLLIAGAIGEVLRQITV